MNGKDRLGLRLCLVVAGIAMASFGITCYYASGFGSDPASVFMDGVHRTLGISYAASSWLVMGIILLAVLPFGRRYFGVGTFLNAVLLGLFINIYQRVLPWATGEVTAMQWRIVLLAVGVVSLGSGLGVYISADLGAGPFDILILTLASRMKKSMAIIRLCCDFLFAIAGWALGGVFWIGTGLGVALTGPIIQVVITAVRSLLNLGAAEKQEASLEAETPL